MRRLESERDILAMKLRSAERDADGFKAEVEKLKRQIKDLEEDEASHQKTIDDLRARLKALQGGGDDSESGAGKRGDGSKGKKGKNGKKGDGYKSPGGTMYTPGGTRIGNVKDSLDGAAGSDADDSDSLRGAARTEDKCVGGGPGPGLTDEPIRARGHAARPLLMNKTGKVFVRTERSDPMLATLGPSIANKASTSLSRDLPMEFSLGDSDMGQVEPFLQHMWEQRKDALAGCPRKQLLTIGACGATGATISASPRQMSLTELTSGPRRGLGRPRGHGRPTSVPAPSAPAPAPSSPPLRSQAA